MKRRILIITMSLSACLLLTLAACQKHQPSTALTVAAERGDVAQVKQLIAAGADVNEKDKWGHTALMWAARKGHAEIARALVEARADMNVRDCASAGWTPLMHAIHKNQNDLARLLIERGADVHVAAGDCRERKNEGGKTALAYAAANDNAEIVKALLARGANPYGMHGADSALSYAVAGTLDVDHLVDGKCPTETVKALLERAPDLNLKGDIWDRKAIFIARQKGCTELVALLERHRSMLGVNQGGSRLGSHLVKVSPACWTKESSSSDGAKHSFACGDTTVVIDGERLIVNGQSYGTLKQGDTVEVEQGKVRVNATEVAAGGLVASK
ncbi:MAG TPA: ankyrin repeat domain-containing protein [Pyrinomonadaceae bacterium]|nr:ankyrin repeat domain-containing protein [Pyrinomonadaceae bacterium]